MYSVGELASVERGDDPRDSACIHACSVGGAQIETGGVAVNERSHASASRVRSNRNPLHLGGVHKERMPACGEVLHLNEALVTEAITDDESADLAAFPCLNRAPNGVECLCGHFLRTRSTSPWRVLTRSPLLRRQSRHRPRRTA